MSGWEAPDGRKICQCPLRDCLGDILSDDYVCSEPQRVKLRAVGLLDEMEGSHEWPDA